MSILYKSCSHHDFIDPAFLDNFDLKIPAKVGNENFNFNGKSNNIEINLIPSGKEKYTNKVVFSKRDFYFNKSLERNKTSFKYNKYSSFDNLIKATKYKNIRKIRNNKKSFCNLEKNNSSNFSLYLTEFAHINKNDSNSKNHIMKKNKSHFFENSQISNNIITTNYLNSIGNNSAKTNNNNSLLNDYLSFCRGKILYDKTLLVNRNNDGKIKNNKINLKLYNPKYLLKTFEIDTKKEKLNKQKIELEYKQLYKKNRYINISKNNENQRKRYIDSFNDYFKEKLNFSILKEKTDNLNDEFKNELNLLKIKEKEATKNYEDFNEIFFVKFYDYIKQILKQTQKEKLKNDKYINEIFSLKKNIYTLQISIKKIKINFEFLNKIALLNAAMHLKKISLPKYYEYILENKKDEIKKLNLNKEEINNIKNYRKNINFKEMLSLLEEYENRDLDLLSELNYLKNDIVILNNQKKNLAIELKNKNNYINELIYDNERMLEKLKTKYQELINSKNKINLYVNKNIREIIEKDSNNKVRKSLVIINYNKLHDKIINIFNKLNEHLNHDPDNIKLPKEKEGIQSIILFYLKKIEDFTLILLSKINTFKKSNKKEIQKMLGESIKMRKALKQRKERELSIKLMNKRIEEKNKKVIIKKRINIYNFNVLTKHKKNSNTKKIIKADTIFDYLNPTN